MLKENAWYEDSVRWFDAKDPGWKGLKINVPSIWIGRIKKVESGSIYLEDAERLKPYKMFSKDLCLWKIGKLKPVPKKGEIWAFRVMRGLKGGMYIKKASRIVYDSSLDSIKIVDALSIDQ